MKTNFDFTFEPLRHEDGRLIVADEKAWKQLEALEHKATIVSGYTAGIATKPAKIFINCETLFAGHEGPLFDGNDRLPGGIAYKLLKGVPVPIYCNDIIQRLFQIIDQSKAEFYLWVGGSIMGFLDFIPYDLLWNDPWTNIHIGTTPANAEKLEAIKHLVKGIFIFNHGV